MAFKIELRSCDNEVIIIERNAELIDICVLIDYWFRVYCDRVYFLAWMMRILIFVDYDFIRRSPFQWRNDFQLT
jgi:hypothetical protein